MTHEEAWDRLKRCLLVRGEYFLYAQGDDPNSFFTLGLKSIETTLDQMKAIEKDIDPPDNVRSIYKK